MITDKDGGEVAGEDNEGETLEQLAQTLEKPSWAINNARKRSADEDDDDDSDTLHPIGKGTGKKRKIISANTEAATSTKPSWEQMFFQLVLYSARRGSCQVPKNHPVDIVGISKSTNRGSNLGKFVSDLRQCRRVLDSHVGTPKISIDKAESILTPDRIEALDKIGFVWTIIPKEEGKFKHSIWEQHYEELKQHHGEHGNCEPINNSRLWNWCDRQRTDNSNTLGTTVHIGASARKGMGFGEDMKPGKKKRLILKQSAYFKEVWNKRKAKLDGLGFVWSKKPQRMSWEDRFETLKVYKAEHGHCNVPQHYHLNKPLGKWCNKNRTDYNNYQKEKKSPMTLERITLLESIGFQWSVKKRHPANQSGEEEDGGDEVEVDQAGKEEEDDDATGGNEDEANQPGEVDDDDDAYEDYVQSNCAGV
mmetsp:Transcript_26831/g.46615  ORF Transcript_26831/g.46615 Transcript_26831/m.46615 type:complete len:420 (-) Transcript_26831:334-1593(-)